MLELDRKPAGPGHSGAATAPARAFHDEARIGSTTVQPGATSSPKEPLDFNGKLPAITGECHFKGSMSIDGLVSGQIGAKSGTYLKQKPSGAFATQAELTGQFQFKSMVRVNGHIAGSIYSGTGTIIVDAEAQVDARVEVPVAVIGGTVRGDIIARERVELGPRSRIYGNIWTRSIVIKDGAIFEGVCRMVDELGAQASRPATT